jgi:hypothetical protein
MSISVPTRAYSNDRSGSNTEENVLTAAAVRSRGIKRLFSLPLPGDRRGAEAQPLIVPAVALPGGRIRDLILLATMANQVFAFDANDAPASNYAKLAAPPIWFTFYPGPQVSATPNDISTLNQHFFSGPITSTPRRSIGTAPGMATCCSAGAKTATSAPGASSPMV